MFNMLVLILCTPFAMHFEKWHAFSSFMVWQSVYFVRFYMASHKTCCFLMKRWKAL